MAQRLGILVAGGRGLRLGLDAPKALVRVGGTTLLERALAVLRAVCDGVVVCAPRALELPVPAALRVDDGIEEAGPLAGLVAGLSSRGFARALAIGVDLPFLEPAALRALGERLARHAAVLPEPGGTPQPLAAWYAPRAREPLAAALASGRRALTAEVLALRPLRVPDATLETLPGGSAAFFNVNSPEDLAAAERRLAAKQPPAKELR